VDRTFYSNCGNLKAQEVVLKMKARKLQLEIKP